MMAATASRPATREDPQAFEVGGRTLHCPLCDHDLFWERHTLLNTEGMTFLGLEWANKEAWNLVCASCDHMLWFHD